MSQLTNCISAAQDFNPIDLIEITSVFEERNIKKGEYLIESGKVCREMAFIESGYLRMWNDMEDKEVTIWIGQEGTFITSVASFVFETNSIWNIEAVTDCKIQSISKSKHVALCQKFNSWLEFDNMLLARAYFVLENRFFNHLHTTSRERFEKLMNDCPKMFNSVPLQYIASMIGVTPETLSRLRRS
ncbi:MAG: Crp/Fnr family transcriptional regulator [Salibacteraceae bacterium]